jgi:gentisate 1,2-dioxygenase
MTENGFVFIDRTGLSYEPPKITKPIIVSKEQLEAEVERLAALAPPANGRRMSIICSPTSGAGNGFAPGTGIALSVLKPGERTKPIRHNSSLVNFCIRGAGHTKIGDKEIRYSLYDVWNTPPWAVYEHFNETNQLQVRLTYSNAPLLEKMNVHIVDENPKVAAFGNGDHHEQHVNPFGTFEIGQSGAFLMPYEKLISPDVAPHQPLHWPWQVVKNELEKLRSLGQSYRGRRLYLLYNPSTERTNGTTNNFFAAITLRPPNIVDRPHRHTASAINYFYGGRGYSVVEGERYEWKAGDLMLTAPGWAIHNHASYDEDVYELTIQDSPLNIWMGSLLWQENLNQPLEVLGATGGFATNRSGR